MKILQVLPALEQGGVERGTVEIAAALSRAGIENAVVSSGGAMVRQLEEAGVRHFTMKVQSKNPLRIVANAFAIASLAKKGGYTLMHVRSRAPAWSVYFASKISRIPYIATYHGLYGTSPRLFKIPYNRVMLKGVKTIAVSDCVREHILENYKVDPSKVVRIHRGADTAKFHPGAVEPSDAAAFRESLGFSEGMRIVTLPGRLTYWKGQRDLLSAAAMMSHRDLGILFVGSDQGRSDYSAGLKDMASRLPEGMKVVFLEHTDDMPLVYAASDIVVSASSAQPEAFGRVIPEAQAMGRLVVGTAHGGACETISDGETGFLVPPGDPRALAAKLDHVLDMPGLEAAAVREAAAKSARENFSTAKMCERTIRLYRELCRE